MTTPKPRPDTDQLLSHASFVRAMARAAVAGDDLVDDVVQDTWAVALVSRPRDPARLRAWLGSVARRRGLDQVRKAARRRQYERAAISRGSSPSAAELASRVEAGRRLVDAVLALSASQRECILLRYYEGLKPAAIARKEGLPVETVRTRIKRGLAVLRTRLDEEHGGDRRAWAAPLLGWFKPVAVASTSWLSLGLGVLVVVLAVGGALWLWGGGRGHEPGAPRPAPRVADSGPGLEPRTSQVPSASSTSRTAPGADTVPLPPVDVADLEPLVIAGHVVGQDGRVRSEVDVYLQTEADPLPDGWQGPDVTTTEEDGSFSFEELGSGRYRLTAISRPVRLLDSADARVRQRHSTVLQHVRAGTHDVRIAMPGPSLEPHDEDAQIKVLVLGPRGDPVPSFGYATKSLDGHWVHIDGRAEPDPGMPAAIELFGPPPHHIHIFGAGDAEHELLPYGEAMLESVQVRDSPYRVVLRALPADSKASSISGQITGAHKDRRPTVVAWYRLDAQGRAAAARPLSQSEDPRIATAVEYGEVDGQGRFTFHRLPPGDVYITVGTEDGGYDTPWVPGRVVPVGMHDIELDAGSLATTTLHLAVPERSLEGEISLALFRRAGGGRVLVTTPRPTRPTGPLSTVRLPDLPPDWRVDIEVVVEDGYGGPGAYGALRNVRVGSTYDLTLEKMAAIQGRAVDAKGLPLEGVEIQAVPAGRTGVAGLLQLDPAKQGVMQDALEDLIEEHPEEAWEASRVRIAQTDEDGCFVLPNLWPGGWLLGGTTGRLVAVQRQPVAAGARDVELVFRAHRQVPGRIEGIADASAFIVQAFEEATPRRYRTASSVSSDGFFVCHNLRVAQHVFVAWNPHDPMDLRYAQSAPRPASGGSVALKLRKGRVIEGEVVDAAGRAVPFTPVRITGPFVDRTLTADTDGRFRVWGLPPGRMELSATTLDGRRGRVIVGPSESAARIVVAQ